MSVVGSKCRFPFCAFFFFFFFFLFFSYIKFFPFSIFDLFIFLHQTISALCLRGRQRNSAYQLISVLNWLQLFLLMAEPIRSGGDISTEIGIPTGLNRIKTRRESSKDQLNWKPDDDDKFHESRPRGISRPPANQKHNKGHAKFAGSIEGLRFWFLCFFVEFLNSAWFRLVAEKISEQEKN